MRDSILVSSIRSFFIALFAMIGICAGFLPLILIFTLLSSTTSDEPESSYKQEIVANANGVRKQLSSDAPVILKLNISGVIGTELLSMDAVRQQLIESREGDLKNDRVKAILLTINSPGGTVIDADGIYLAIKHYKEKYKTPVFAYVDGLCASGGMYIAAAADMIYASEISLVGSVGVITPTFFNFSQVLDKFNVQALTLYAGKGKDEMNPLRPWKADESDSLKGIIDYYYHNFVDIVTRDRPKLDKTKLVNDYGAHVFYAKQALEYGYIDGAGFDYSQTLTLLAKQIGIEDDYYQVIEMQSNHWFASLFKGDFSLLKGKLTHQIQLVPELDAKLMNQFLYLYRPERL